MWLGLISAAFAQGAIVITNPTGAEQLPIVNATQSQVISTQTLKNWTLADVPIATTSTPGIIKPDGTLMTVNGSTGLVAFPGLLPITVTAAATAAGTTQGTATSITAATTIFTTVSSGTGGILSGVIGFPQTVYNRGVSALSVYPPSNAQIESAGTNVAVTVAVGGSATFRCVTSAQCYAGV